MNKTNSEDGLKIFAIMTALIGIFALALWGLYYLVFLVLLGKPLVSLSSNNKPNPNIPAIIRNNAAT